MIGGLVVAGVVSFAGAFVLRMAAFALLAFMTSGIYLAVLLHGGSALVASLGSTAILLATMQVAYTLGALALSRARGAARRHSPDRPETPRSLQPRETNAQGETHRL